MLNRDCEYPQTELARAWKHLLLNDEHSYGASGYKGRKVYETWVQHIDWVDKALNTGRTEGEKALRMIASHIPTDRKTTVVFNSTAQQRHACVVSEDGTKYALADIPPSDKFRVERYTDSGLRHHACYYYRVRAVNRAGVEGPLSEVCWAYTQEDETNL